MQLHTLFEVLAALELELVVRRDGRQQPLTEEDLF